METVEVKVSDLEGAALDWAVANVVGLPMEIEKVCGGFCGIEGETFEKFQCCGDYSYVMRWPDGTHYIPSQEPGDARMCRAIVSAKLGDTVSVPKELLK